MEIMNSNLFQNIMYQMNEASGRKVGILDENAVVVASSDFSMLNLVIEPIEKYISETFGTFVCEGYTYKVLDSHGKVDYIVFVEGEDEAAKTFCAIIGVSLLNIKQLYDEKYEKVNFIKNVMLDNILPGDIYIKSKEFRVDDDVCRFVFLIKANEVGEVTIYEVIKNIFPEKSKDFIINLDERNVVLVKEVKKSATMDEMETIAKTIVDTVGVELFTKITIGISAPADTIKDIARAYKEAKISLEVGKIFDAQKPIVNYESLGIGRLIYHLPTTLCELFLNEIFKKGSIDVLDQEIIITIQEFFANSLNVSETARKLFVHRNTLVYRLDKIYKLTGLDLRMFDDAIVFKVAMMVKNYLTSNPIKL